MTDKDGAEDVDGGQDKPRSRADSIRLPAIPPRPKKWPVGPADDYPSFGAKTGDAGETGAAGEIDAGPLLASTTQAQTVAGPPKRRRPLIVGIIGAVVVLLAAAVVIWQWPGGTSTAGGVQEAAAAPADAAAPAPGGAPSTRKGSTGPRDAAVAPSGGAAIAQPSPGASHPAGASVPTATTAADGSTPTPTTATTRGTTPALTGKTNPSGANLARGGTATASSVEDPRWTASMAIDGDETNSRWSSTYSDPQWWKIDLGQTYQLTTVTLFWERAHAVAYRVETSTDGSSWKTIYSTSAGQGGTVPVSAKGSVARYVRVYGTQRFNEYGYSLYEVEVR